MSRIAFGDDFRRKRARRRAWWWFWWTDHAWIRAFWANLDQVAPGVWRSNQPSPRRLFRFQQKGIRTIITLRGESRWPHHVFEANCCRHLGIELVPVQLRARNLVEREVLLDLLDLFDRLEKPFLFHCKSGADRAGLAAALYLLHADNAPIDVAKRQLSLKYAHVRRFRTGILDFLLERYAQDIQDRPMPIREWIETRYDKKALTQDFQDRRARGLF